jgi:ssDNA-specific exonuclease RecJ
MAEIEAMLARGDRKLSGVIYNAWKLGAKFDDWREQFRADLWDRAFKEANIDKDIYLRSIPQDEQLAWEHIEV